MRWDCVTRRLASLLPRQAGRGILLGRAKTTQWEDCEHDERPYELELIAVDECQRDEVLVAAAAGSMRSGIWGELLSTAARNRGCAGALIDGAVRDVAPMDSMGFLVLPAALARWIVCIGSESLPWTCRSR